jgi:hypothetical protein
MSGASGMGAPFLLCSSFFAMDPVQKILHLAVEKGVLSNISPRTRGIKASLYADCNIPEVKHFICTLIVFVNLRIKLNSQFFPWNPIQIPAHIWFGFFIHVLLQSRQGCQYESCSKCPNIPPVKISYFSEAHSYFFRFNLLFVYWKKIK